MSFKEPGLINVILLRFAADIVGRSEYRKLVDSLQLEGIERVLDFGSGTGAASMFIAQALVKAGGRLTCVDMSTVWMNIIKKRLKKYPNVEFKLGDISELEIEAGSYDIILINFVLHDVEKDIRQRTVNALSRALKKTGKLYIKEPTGRFHGLPDEEIKDLMANGGLKRVFLKKIQSFGGPPGPKCSGVFIKQ